MVPATASSVSRTNPEHCIPWKKSGPEGGRHLYDFGVFRFGAPVLLLARQTPCLGEAGWHSDEFLGRRRPNLRMPHEEIHPRRNVVVGTSSINSEMAGFVWPHFTVFPTCHDDVDRLYTFSCCTECRLLRPLDERRNGMASSIKASCQASRSILVRRKFCAGDSTVQSPHFANKVTDRSMQSPPP